MDKSATLQRKPILVPCMGDLIPKVSTKARGWNLDQASPSGPLHHGVVQHPPHSVHMLISEELKTLWVQTVPMLAESLQLFNMGESFVLKRQ